MAATQTVNELAAPYFVTQQDQCGTGSSVNAEEPVPVEAATRRHPLGVKPSGNALTSAANIQDALGSLSILPDYMILLLFEYLDEYSLVNFGKTCRALFAYSVYDQLWRDVAVNSMSPGFEWRGSWRASKRRLTSATLPNVDCSSLFADALYRPYQCSQILLDSFTTKIPKGNQIARLTDLDLHGFDESWTDRPFVLTQPVKTWKVFTEWDTATLLTKYADTVFRAEALDWPLRTYVDYMTRNNDESPLYLFDCGFVEKMGLDVGTGGAYNIPDCFKEDLFMLLGNDRPDHRWLIVGPERSGSTFHKDPNATSAWNAVIRGSKYWIMFPNSVIPPGVYMSEDQSEVTSPLSIAEWLLTFHEEARNTPGCIEGICREGEVLHVPSGWWHLVVNLEPAIAVTQNFVPRAHLRAAVSFLKNKADQVSGFSDTIKDPYTLFMKNLETARPDLYKQLKETSERKRKWEEVVTEQSEQQSEAGGFSFGFADDIDEESD